MRLLFYAVSTLGLYFFIVRSRRFDLFTVAFGSALVYFLPGFFGFVRYPPRQGFDATVPLAASTYLVFCITLASIVGGAWLFEQLPFRRPRLWIAGSVYAGPLALAGVALGLGMALVTSGSALFDYDKSVVLAQLDRWYLLGTSSLVLLTAFGFARRSKSLLCISACGVLFDLFVGFRDTAAFSAISVLVLYLSDEKARSLLREHWRALAPVLCLLPILLIYKQLAFLIKLGELEQIIANLGNSDVYVSAVMYSEPFGIQTILNEILVKDYHVSAGHLLGAANNFLLYSGALGLDNISFNDYFQPALFPYADYGMANNIWAEMLATGSWPLLLAFIFLFNAVLAGGSYILHSDHPEIRAAAAVLGGEWAFYIHRNDLGYQLTIEKRTLLLAAGYIAMSVLLVFASRAYEPVNSNQRKPDWRF